PFMWPRSRRASRIVSAREDSLAESRADRYPTSGTFFGCCASPLAPYIVSATTIANNPLHFGPRGRFWIADFRLSERNFEGNAFIGSFSWLSIQNLKSKI